MELHQVRAFVTVARVGNVTKAADVLCVTQPAVTAQLKAFEASLGVALFDRSGGRMTLTRTGERLWHFQTVRHDLWDHDNPCPPLLVTDKQDGKPRKAVAQVQSHVKASRRLAVPRSRRRHA